MMSGNLLIRVLCTIQLFIVMAFTEASQAASMDQYVTCGLVYGALFQAAKDADHQRNALVRKTSLASRPAPSLEENKEKPRAKEKLHEIAARLETEVGNRFAGEATIAIGARPCEIEGCHATCFSVRSIISSCYAPVSTRG
jgi:hypothetical protein